MKSFSASFAAIGTNWQLHVESVLSDTAWLELLESVRKRIDNFDTTYSRFRADSFVTRLSQQAGQYALPADALPLLRWYEQLYEVTAGKVTPLIGQTLADAGYDAEYSLKPKPLSPVPLWEDTLSYTADSISLQRPALLDFGAAGKGYLVDIIGQQLEAAGIDTYMIDAGGDIRQRSALQIADEIGLENPADNTEAIAIVALCNQSLCASAGTKRKWGDFHHIIDPTTQRSTQDIVATWVLASDTMTADGLATALFFTPPADLVPSFRFAYALLDSASNLSYSADFPVKLFEAA